MDIITNANGEIVLLNDGSAIGLGLPALNTPAISLVSGTTIQIDTIDDNAETIEVYTDGTKIDEVAKQGGATKQTIDVSTLIGWESLASGNHSITVKTKASGYLDSASSNAVTVSKVASGGFTVTVDSSWFYNTGNLVRINGVEQELDGQKTYTFNNVNTFNIYSSTAMSDITSGTGSIPATHNWSSGWAWSTDIAITQDSSCVVSNDN